MLPPMDTNVKGGGARRHVENLELKKEELIVDLTKHFYANICLVAHLIILFNARKKY